jgi:hypothetical protein
MEVHGRERYARPEDVAQNVSPRDEDATLSLDGLITLHRLERQIISSRMR